jgi:hypothetical protein
MLQPVPLTLGISAGTSSQSSGLIAFSNSNGISFGESNGTITASYTTPTQTVDTGGVYAVGNTSGTSSGTYDARTLSISGAGAVTVAASNSGYIVNVPVQSNQTLGIYLTGNTYAHSSSSTVDARSISILGDAAVSVGWDSFAHQLDIGVLHSLAFFGVSNTGNTAGNTGTWLGAGMVLAGTGNCTVSQSTVGGGGASVTEWISVATQTVQPAVPALGVSNTGATAGNTGTSSGITWVFAGSNGITALQSTTGGGPDTIWLSYVGQSAPPAVSSLGVSNTGNTAGNTGVNSGTIWVFAASGAITASESTALGGPNTIWYSVAAQTTQPAVNAFGVSNTGNTAGNTGTSSGITWVVAGSNNITASESTAVGGPNTVWISGPTTVAQSNQTGGVYAAGNTFGTSSGTYDARTLSISATSGLQAAASNSGWVIADQALSAWEPFPALVSLAFISRSVGTWYFQKMNLPRMLIVSNLVVHKSFNVTVPGATSQASSGSDKWSYSHGITIFSRQNYGASSTNFTTVTTASFGMTASLSYTSTAQSFAYSWVTNTTGGTTSFSTTSNSGNWSSYLTGGVQVSIPCVTTFTQGEYWIAHAHSQTTATANSNITLVSVSDLGTQPQAEFAVGVLGSSGMQQYLIAGGPFVGTATAVTTNNTMPATVVNANLQLTNFWMGFSNL